MSPSLNPSYESVAAQIIEQIRQGSTLAIAANAAEQVPIMFEKSIRFRLENVPDAWVTEGENVLHASRQLGALAEIIANLHHETVVEQFAVEAAARIVQEHCQIGYRAGHWCE